MVCIVAVSGPTSAGKTYFSNKLAKLAEEHNISCSRISTDEFYRDLSNMTMDERTKINYDEPSSIDAEEFVKVIENLSNNKSATIPVYDFSTHTRTGDVRTVEPTQLVIVEGIFSLTFQRVLEFYTLSIYVDLEPDLRLIRRVHRDIEERGRSLDSVFNQYLSSVRPTQREYVSADREKADVLLLGDKDHSTLINMILSFVEHQSEKNRM